MGCIQSVISDAAELSGGEVIPWGAKVFQVISILDCQIRNVSCERLIKPEIIPPLHGDQIAKPVVCQLVQDCGK